MHPPQTLASSLRPPDPGKLTASPRPRKLTASPLQTPAGPVCPPMAQCGPPDPGGSVRPPQTRRLSVSPRPQRLSAAPPPDPAAQCVPQTQAGSVCPLQALTPAECQLLGRVLGPQEAL